MNGANAETRGWNAQAWTSQDDRVRGGKSQSYLECGSGRGALAVFHGNLDIATLGGAGFASQRTTADGSESSGAPWDLSRGGGVLLRLGRGDGKRYTLTLKDEEASRRPDGREQSTVSWEYDFVGRNEEGGESYIPWADFKPTYRGKAKPDAKPLDLKSVKRVGIMMRRWVSLDMHTCLGMTDHENSFFGEQEGPFRLEIKSISVTEKPSHDKDDSSVAVKHSLESTSQYSEKPGYVAPKTTWKSLLCGFFR